MRETLSQAFSWICGQDVLHTWMSGGRGLPCCQRCTGLYTGALVAVVLLNLLRPSMTRSLLWAHGVMLALMVPFGFHWLPQGALVRGWTGVLFGFGLVAFLRLPITRRDEPSESPSVRGVRLWSYWAGVAGTLAAIAVLDFESTHLNADAISLVLSLGAVVLFGLVAVNVSLGICGLRCGLSHRRGMAL